MDWNVMVQYLPQYEKAAWLTLRLGVAGIFWAIFVGLVCAVLQYEKVLVLRRIVGAYIQLSRNTPLLVQLFFLYYGLPKIGIKTNAELCGIAGLAFLGGSYMAEAFRSGLDRKCPEPWHESAADHALCGAAAGGLHQYAGLYGQYHLPAQGDQRVQRHQPDGSDVHGKRPHRPVL